MTKRRKGNLIIIGGHEDKEGDREILTQVAKLVNGSSGKLVVVTVATQYPEEVSHQYKEIFGELGVKNADLLDIRSRDEAFDEANVRKVEEAKAIFFTGGDQLRITSQIGDSLVYQCMQKRHEEGCTIIGTSAGAAVMPETMLIYGNSDDSFKISALGMAPGLGLIGGVVIDSHFAERGRMGRLLGAVAQNPKNLGIGIDEDTAIIVEDHSSFKVIGSGAVYVVDGARISYSSLSERNPEGIASIYDVKLHVLAKDDHFDLVQRRPVTEENVLVEKVAVAKG